MGKMYVIAFQLSYSASFEHSISSPVSLIFNSLAITFGMKW